MSTWPAYPRRQVQVYLKFKERSLPRISQVPFCGGCAARGVLWFFSYPRRASCANRDKNAWVITLLLFKARRDSSLLRRFSILHNSLIFRSALILHLTTYIFSMCISKNTNHTKYLSRFTRKMKRNANIFCCNRKCY